MVDLFPDSVKLRMLCANAIFRLAEEDESRNLVRMHGGLEKLVEMMKDDLNKPKAQSNMPVMAAVTGALWKCATNNLENVDRLQVVFNWSQSNNELGVTNKKDCRF